jgi:hypothetical protein
MTTQHGLFGEDIEIAERKRVSRQRDKNTSIATVFSSGNGVQSVATCVLMAQGKIDCSHVVFCNVGEDSENPKTLAYGRNVLEPFLSRHGIRYVEVSRVHRRRSRRHNKTPGDTFPTLMEYTLTEDNRSIPVCMRMQNGSPGNRSCTMDWKIKVFHAYCKEQLGATPQAPAVKMLGISIDEIERVNWDSGDEAIINDYPLVDLQISRAGCVEIIEAAGLPVPSRSACWFCPFTKPSEWLRRKNEEPELFQRAVEFERRVNEKRRRIGKDQVFLAPFGVDLETFAAGEYEQSDLEMFDTCESGHCMT